MSFTFIDLFAGIGGFRLGMEANGGECVFTSEWDKHAEKTYRANHTVDHPFAGDITKVDASDIPDHDMLCAGFPCQPFSTAGQRKGFEHATQGTLFFDVARIIDVKKPQAFLLENVPGLVHHNAGHTLRTILRVLCTELGYHVRAAMVNSCHWVPQSRPRLFIAGFKNPCSFDFDQIDTPISGGVLAGALEAQVDNKYTFTDRQVAAMKTHKERQAAQGNTFSAKVCSKDKPLRTLTTLPFSTGGGGLLIEQERGNPRSLTPRECARVMGYADSFVIPGSHMLAMKQFGNSVVPPVIAAIAKTMLLYMVDNPPKVDTYVKDQLCLV